MVGVEPTEVLLRGSEIRRENNLGWCIKPSLKTWDLLPTSTGEFAKNPEPSTNYELMAAEKTPVKGGIAVIVDRSRFEGETSKLYTVYYYICVTPLYLQAFFDLKIQETVTSNIWVNFFCRIFPGHEVPRTSPWMFMSNISMSNMASTHKLHNPKKIT